MTIDRVNDWCFVGATVSLDRWDRTERTVNRMGPSRVTLIQRRRCESGYIVTVESDRGKQSIDLHWLAPLGTVWTTCNNPACRIAGGRSVYCSPGQESTAQCNECSNAPSMDHKSH